MPNKRKGEVLFISPDKEVTERIEEIRRIIKNGLSHNTELQPLEVLAAEQTANYVRIGSGSRIKMEQRLNALTAEQLTGVIRRLVYSSIKSDNEKFAEELTAHEQKDGERNFNFGLIALELNEKKKFYKALLVAEKITEELLKKTVQAIIEKNIPETPPIN